MYDKQTLVSFVYSMQLTHLDEFTLLISHKMYSLLQIQRASVCQQCDKNEPQSKMSHMWQATSRSFDAAHS